MGWDMHQGGLHSGEGRTEKGWSLLLSIYCELCMLVHLRHWICSFEGRG